jgi:hypothetical protein
MQMSQNPAQDKSLEKKVLEKKSLEKKFLQSLSPLAYCPPYLGAKNEKISPLVALGAFIKDPKIWQLSAELDGANLQVNLKGSLIENLYKESQVVLPNGVIAPQSQYYQVYASLSTMGWGANSGIDPTYLFNLWVVDNLGVVVEEYSLPIKPLLELLYPEARTTHINWKRHLMVDHVEEGHYNWKIKVNF